MLANLISSPSLPARVSPALLFVMVQAMLIGFPFCPVMGWDRTGQTGNKPSPLYYAGQNPSCWHNATICFQWR